MPDWADFPKIRKIPEDSHAWIVQARHKGTGNQDKWV